MKKQEILHQVPASAVDEIRGDFESEGASVEVRADGSGTFTVTATWDEVAPHLATPLALRAATLTGAALGQGAAAEAAPGAITATQRRTAEAIINLFETSEVLGQYGQVTLIPGDTGRLTFGRSQTTLGSGNLARLVKQYVANPGSRFGQRLLPFVALFEQKAKSLDTDVKLHNVLRATADDPAMRDTQDAFFDAAYWQPAMAEALRLGIHTPLGIAIVYDSFVHGSWAGLRDRVKAAKGSVQGAGEQAWISAYVATRHDWLANHQRADLRPTVYRMEAFRRLIDQGFWGLELPLVVRGQEISIATLSALPPGCYDGPAPGSRPLAVQSPFQRGLDVRTLQLGLSDQGADIRADGVFGQTSVSRLRDFQKAHGLAPTGVADQAVWAVLLA
jgi:chitosanase